MLRLLKLKLAEKGLKNNISKTKALISGKGLPSEFPCSLFIGARANSVYCSSCPWVNECYSKVNDPLMTHEIISWVRYQGLSPAIERELLKFVVDKNSLVTQLHLVEDVLMEQLFVVQLPAEKFFFASAVK